MSQPLDDGDASADALLHDLDMLDDTCDAAVEEADDKEPSEIGGVGPRQGAEFASSAHRCEVDSQSDRTTAMAADQGSEKSVAADPEGFAQHIAKKVCAGCLISALTPSPLCAGPHRAGDYPDWSSNWDKHCASLARCRYLPLHGSLTSLSEWLKESKRNRDEFCVRVVAYYSLKKEGSMERVSWSAIEVRAEQLMQLIAWHRNGVGVPQVLNFGLGPMLDLVEVANMGTNPLLKGGVVHDCKREGALVLQVCMPMEAAPAIRGAAPCLVTAGGCEGKKGELMNSLVSNVDVRLPSCSGQIWFGSSMRSDRVGLVLCFGHCSWAVLAREQCVGLSVLILQGYRMCQCSLTCAGFRNMGRLSMKVVNVTRQLSLPSFCDSSSTCQLSR